MEHPLQKIARIEAHVDELERAGDRDGVIEARIHQLSLEQLLQALSTDAGTGWAQSQSQNNENSQPKPSLTSHCRIIEAHGRL